MGNSQQLCERKSLSAGCPQSMRTNLPPASRSIPLLSPFMGRAHHSALQDSGSRFPDEPRLLSTQYCKGGTKGHFTLVSMVGLGLYEDFGQRESPVQDGAKPRFRSWLLRPAARSPQRCREKAESRGGSEETGLSGSEFTRKALSEGHGFLAHKLCS